MIPIAEAADKPRMQMYFGVRAASLRVRLMPLLAVALGIVLGCGGGGGTIDGPIDTFFPSTPTLQYLRATTHSKLVLEVDRVAGFEPRASSSSSLVSRLDTLLDKPGGITVVVDETIPSRGSDHVWTFAELDALAASTFNHIVDGDTVKMHVLFLDGRYGSPGGGTVLGVAWNQVNIAIFKQTIEETCAGTIIPPLLADQLCADAELAIWLHEVGHVIGLVDKGIPMVVDHEDHDHEGHDRSTDCVMYWAYEGDALVSRIADDLIQSGSSALDFDQDCLDDIAAVRAGG